MSKLSEAIAGERSRAEVRQMRREISNEMSRFPNDDDDQRQTNLKTMSWRDSVSTEDESQSNERPGFGMGQLGDGDTITLTFESDGDEFESQYGESVRFECVFNESTAAVEDFDENVLSPNSRATMITGSKRLLAALAGVDENLVGNKVQISKTGDGMDVQYSADLL